MQNTVQVFAVGIGYKNLSKTVACHQLDDLLHTRGIQLVKDIVQQQQGNSGPGTFQEIKLCQLQRYQISLVLSLRPFTLDGEITQKHIQLVLVHTAQRIAHNLVASTAFLQHFQQRGIAGMRVIA